MSRKPVSRFPLAHTFSIIARDSRSGDLGVAVQSHWFSVGSIVPWAEPGVGVVATQAMVNVSYGPVGMEELRREKLAPEVMKGLLEKDDAREVRQVALMDSKGNVAVHTGSHCIAEAGHFAGEGFSTQANMMANDTVWKAMADAYVNARGDLAERILVSMEAGQAAGGDIRGQQSAAILVVRGTASDQPWRDVLYDLRVEDHPKPIEELRRLVTIQRAYHLMNQGDEYLSTGKIDDAVVAYQRAASIAPNMIELPFWHAVTLADLDKIDEALPIFKRVFDENPAWAVLVQRLPAAGLMKDDPVMMARILALVAG